MQVIIAGGLVGGLSIWLRSAMLKPGAKAWASAPSPVSLSLAALGILLLVMTWAMVKAGGRPTYDELMWWLAIVVAALALTGLVLLVNLWLQHRRPVSIDLRGTVETADLVRQIVEQVDRKVGP
jgi:ammonia channel protein AmtB